MRAMTTSGGAMPALAHGARCVVHERMRARLRHAACVALGSMALGLTPGAAQAEPPAGALIAVRDADPLELARVAARLGDAAVLALLAPSQPVAAQLAAVRAAPWLREPERALLPIAELIAGRDSELAPAAARAALQITRALDADALARRELLPDDLAPALSALARAAVLSRVRDDLRRMAAAAAEQLRAAGVPEPAAK